MTRVQLIEKLFRTGHLNVPERRELVPSSIHFAEIMAVVRDALNRTSRFSAGKIVLEKKDEGRYCLHHHQYNPQASDLVNEWSGPTIPVSIDYASEESAVIAFMVQVGATRNLDGIEILGFPDRPLLTAEERN